MRAIVATHKPGRVSGLADLSGLARMRFSEARLPGRCRGFVMEWCKDRQAVCRLGYPVAHHASPLQHPDVKPIPTLATLALALLLHACVVVPRTDSVYDDDCKVQRRQMTLEVYQVGAFGGCVSA